MTKVGMSIDKFKKFDEESGKGSSKLFKEFALKVKPDTVEKVRFVTDGQDDFYLRVFVHEIGSGRSYRSFLCLNDEFGNGSCPFCTAGKSRKFQAYALVYSYNNKKPMFWAHSKTVAGDIAGRIAVRGLRGRDWFISRKGATMHDTTYSLDSEDKKDFGVKIKKEQISFWGDLITNLTKTEQEMKGLLGDSSEAVSEVPESGGGKTEEYDDL